MAKKKAKPKETEELDELEEDFPDDEVVESHYPEIGDDAEKKTEDYDAGSDSTADEEDELGEFDFEEELEEEIKYKYLDLRIAKGSGDNDYKVVVEGQSHGFLNIFVKHLLEVEGVNAAAYKVTQVFPPEIFIRIDDGYKIKDVLSRGIETLRSEVTETQKVFEKLMK